MWSLQCKVQDWSITKQACHIQARQSQTFQMWSMRERFLHKVSYSCIYSTGESNIWDCCCQIFLHGSIRTQNLVDEILKDILTGCEVVTFVKLSHFWKTRTTVILSYHLLGYWKVITWATWQLITIQIAASHAIMSVCRPIWSICKPITMFMVCCIIFIGQMWKQTWLMKTINLSSSSVPMFLFMLYYFDYVGKTWRPTWVSMRRRRKPMMQRRKC